MILGLVFSRILTEVFSQNTSVVGVAERGFAHCATREGVCVGGVRQGGGSGTPPPPPLGGGVSCQGWWGGSVTADYAASRPAARRALAIWPVFGNPPPSRLTKPFLGSDI